MKQYRIQIRSDGLYYNGIVNAENDAEALIQFKNELEIIKVAKRQRVFL